MSLLPALIAKPGAWHNSPVRPLIPEIVRQVLDAAGVTDRAGMLAGISQAATTTDFTTAVTAAQQLISLGQNLTGASLGMLARRIAQGIEPEPADVDLTVYDHLARSVRAAGHDGFERIEVGA